MGSVEVANCIAVERMKTNGRVRDAACEAEQGVGVTACIVDESAKQARASGMRRIAGRKGDRLIEFARDGVVIFLSISC
jgi:hypothetical protein